MWPFKKKAKPIREAPPTDRQIEYIERLMDETGRRVKRPISKSEASAIITHLVEIRDAE